jgi:hypothetical protein
MASPNAITFASLSDLTVASSIDTNFVLLLAERNALPRHPAMYFADPIDQRATNVIKVPHLGLNAYNLASQFADGAAVPNTALSTGSTTITVVRQSLARSATDLARMVQPDGRISPAAFAIDAMMSHASQLTALICDVIDGFTATAGPGTGVALDVVSVMAMIGAGRVNNLAGPAYMGVLHGQQWSHLIQDAGTSLGSAPGGTQQYNPQLAALQFLRGQSYVGSWLGVDWFVNNRVVTANAGADRAGALFAYGGVMIGQGLFTGVVEDPTNQFLIGSMMGPDGSPIGATTLIERDREAPIGETATISHSYVGVSKGIEAGITLISKAAA